MTQHVDFAAETAASPKPPLFRLSALLEGVLHAHCKAAQVAHTCYLQGTPTTCDRSAVTKQASSSRRRETPPRASGEGREQEKGGQVDGNRLRSTEGMTASSTRPPASLSTANVCLAVCLQQELQLTLSRRRLFRNRWTRLNHPSLRRPTFHRLEHLRRTPHRIADPRPNPPGPHAQRLLFTCLLGWQAHRQRKLGLYGASVGDVDLVLSTRPRRPRRRGLGCPRN